MFPPEVQEFSPDTHMMGIKDVSDQMMTQYRQMVQQQNPMMQEPDISNRALIMARADKNWVQVAREYGVMPKDKKQAHLVWEQHQIAMQGGVDDDGKPIDDPLLTNEKALEEFKKRELKSVMGEK